MKKGTLFQRLSYVYILMLLAGPLGYLVRVLYAHNLSVQDYGLFYSIVALVGTLGLFASIGLPQALLYFVPKYRNDNKKLRSVLIYSGVLQLLASITVSSLLFLFAPLLAEYFFKVPSAIWLLRIFAIYLTVFSMGQFLQALFKGYQDERSWAGYELIRLIPLAILSYAIILFIDDNLLFYISIVWTGVVTFRLLVYIWLLIKKIPTPPLGKVSISTELRKELREYSFNILLATGAGALLANLDIIFLTAMTNLSEVALYNIAFPTADVAVLLLGPFLVFVQPLITDFFHHKVREHLRAVIKEIYRLALFVAIPALAFFFLYSKQVIELLFGAQYIGADLTLKVLLIGMLFKIFYLLGFMILAALGKVKERAKYVWLALAINIVLNIILIWYFESAGAAAATGFTFIFLSGVAYYGVSKQLGVLISKKDLLLTTVNTLTLLTVMLTMNYVINFSWFFELAAIGIVAGGVYLTLGLKYFHLIDVQYIKSLLAARFRNK